MYLRAFVDIAGAHCSPNPAEDLVLFQELGDYDVFEVDIIDGDEYRDDSCIEN